MKCLFGMWVIKTAKDLGGVISERNNYELKLFARFRFSSIFFVVVNLYCVGVPTDMSRSLFELVT